MKTKATKLASQHVARRAAQSLVAASKAAESTGYVGHYAGVEVIDLTLPRPTHAKVQLASLTPKVKLKEKTQARTPLTLACVHLGEKVPGEPCGSTLRTCNLHGEITSRYTKCGGAKRHCATCGDYVAKEPK